MFITYHLVEGDEERREIFSRLNPGGIWDGGAVEAMAIAQADDLPLAFAISSAQGSCSSRLSHACFPPEPDKDEIWLHLLDYLAWEIEGMGKSFLKIENIATIGPLARCLGDLGLDLTYPLMVKLGTEGFLSFLRSGA